MRSAAPSSITARARLALFVACIAPCACVLRGGRSSDSTSDGASSRTTVPVDASAGDSVQIVTDQPSYHAGDMIALRVVNRTSQTLGYNACTRTLQRNRVGVWLTLSDTGRVCTMQIQVIPPGTAQVARTVLQSGLTPGEYRVVIRFSAEAGATTQWIAAASNAFQIE